MSGFVSYDPQSGQIMEWGSTSQPGILNQQGADRGLVSILGNWRPETHYIDVQSGQAIERPGMDAEILYEPESLIIKNAPAGAEVYINLASTPAGQCDESGNFHIGGITGAPVVHLKLWPFKDFEWVPNR